MYLTSSSSKFTYAARSYRWVYSACWVVDTQLKITLLNVTSNRHFQRERERGVEQWLSFLSNMHTLLHQNKSITYQNRLLCAGYVPVSHTQPIEPWTLVVLSTQAGSCRWISQHCASHSLFNHSVCFFCLQRLFHLKKCQEIWLFPFKFTFNQHNASDHESINYI